jgi:hypothetical protein
MLQRRARNARYYRRCQHESAEMYQVKITPERHRKLTAWLRLGGHADQIDRANGGEVIARVIDALDLYKTF